jgi:hypothetical protein
MKLLTTALLVFGLATPLFAQQPLTSEEKLKLEKVALLQQIELLTKEVAQWRQLFAQTSLRLGEFEAAVSREQTRAALEGVVKEIEATRPGFEFDPQTGQFKPKKKE